MALALKYAVTLKNARLDAITTAISTSGLLRIYSGTQPTNPDTALSGNTVLAELACSSTFAGSASAGVLTLNSVTGANASATGTATFFSFLTSGGTRKVDGTIGTASCDLTIDSTSITSGQAVSVSGSITITSAN